MKGVKKMTPAQAYLSHATLETYKMCPVINLGALLVSSHVHRAALIEAYRIPWWCEFSCLSAPNWQIEILSSCVISTRKTALWFLVKSRMEAAPPAGFVARSCYRVCFIASCWAEEAWLLWLIQFFRHVFRNLAFRFVSFPSTTTVRSIRRKI